MESSAKVFWTDLPPQSNPHFHIQNIPLSKWNNWQHRKDPADQSFRWKGTWTLKRSAEAAVALGSLPRQECWGFRFGSFEEWEARSESPELIQVGRLIGHFLHINWDLWLWGKCEPEIKPPPLSTSQRLQVTLPWCQAEHREKEKEKENNDLPFRSLMASWLSERNA